MSGELVMIEVDAVEAIHDAGNAADVDSADGVRGYSRRHVREGERVMEAARVARVEALLVGFVRVRVVPRDVDELRVRLVSRMWRSETLASMLKLCSRSRCRRGRA